MKKINKSLSVLLTLVLSLSLLSGCDRKEEAVKETALSVTAAQAEKRDIAQAMKYPGTARGVNEVYIMPKIPARVTTILVKPGDRVSAGQTLLTLDSGDFAAAIKRGEAAVAMAEAGLKANAIQRENARVNYERIQKLFDAGAASQQQLEEVKNGYELLSTGSAEAALEQAQAGLLEARTQMAHCIITSPINGTVGSVNLSLGDTANPASPAAVVSDTSRLEIEALVSESEVSYIKKDSIVEVMIDAAGEKPFQGRVDSVSSVPDPMKRQYTVKVVVDNRDYAIKSGMFAEVVISTMSKQDVLCVPLAAVIPSGGREIVYTVDAKQRAREAEVKTGLRDNRYVGISSGLRPGDQVIIKGNTLISDGTLVKIVAGGDK